MGLIRDTLAILKGRGIKSVSSSGSDVQRSIIEAFNASTLPESVIFFTTHKCASTYVSKLLNILCNNSAYTVNNYASEIWSLGDRIDISSPYEDFLISSYDHLFHRRGFIYAPQRRQLDFPGRDQFKHIFFLRDPRDVLVSAYYSFGFSHGRPINTKHKHKSLLRQKGIKSKGIDQFAIDEAEKWLLPLYTSYVHLLETSQSHLYLSYDDYKDNTERFINIICAYLSVEIGESELKRLIDLASPIQEDLQSGEHRRSGRSRQFVAEFKSETLKRLNLIMEDILKFWHFPVS